MFDIGDVKKQAAKKAQQNDVHQTIFGAVYLNNIARTALSQSGPPTYAEGAVIVREKLETEAGAPEVLTSMIKRQKGFNPEANDWEFLLISGDATKIRKREKMGDCQSCHASVSEKDFVFDRYLPVSATGSSVLQLGVPEFVSQQMNQVLRLKRSGSGL